MLKSIVRGVLAGVILSLPLLSCTATSGVDVEPTIISGTVVGLGIDAELFRVHVLLNRDGPTTGLARVNIVGNADGGRDPLVREVAAGITDGVLALGQTASFVTTGVEVRTLELQYYATKWLR